MMSAKICSLRQRFSKTQLFLRNYRYFGKPVQEITNGEDFNIGVVANGEKVVIAAYDVEAFAVKGAGDELVIVRVPTDVDV